MDTVSYLLGKKNGGGSGTTNYNDLSNKPSINSVELSGNKTLSDLGVQSEIDSTHKLSADLVDDTNTTNKFVTASDKTTWSGKQDALVSGTNIKTINSQSILGSGDLAVSGYDGDLPVYKIGDYTTNTQTFNFDTAKVGRYLPVNGNVTYKYIANGTEGYFYNGNNNGIGEYGITIYKKYSDAQVDEKIGVCEFTYNNNYQYANYMFLTIVKSSNGVSFSQTVDFPDYKVPRNSTATIRAKHTYNVLPESSEVPTTNNQFTNKKYVDDKPTTYAGYDATKTQVLKNINGTLTWVDE